MKKGIKYLLILTLITMSMSYVGYAQEHQHQATANSTQGSSSMQGRKMMGGMGMMSSGNMMQGDMKEMMHSMMLQGPNNAKMLGDFKTPITKDEGLEIARRYVLYSRSQYLQVGEIKDNPDSFDVQIITKKENAVAAVLHIDKKTGFISKD
ncbi:MAG: hypothetical protein DKM50_09690 [Candidatus Margulisiibacteriota bacterium]|nr:MAG: hypothetical protein A2X43_10150 [Candidatus Margulisbacteria bacterium GWD2_39_127]OGI01511.1 MAG: hypothetical protein A2X42_12020 [Candidatus Margulisbacteria bacterium GWF2_38_17]PZM78977.1 MAG: hypothetical protein DKM50_09690 [Candidatus Margulisiibacteriota bacterium]HAR64414.1 hypothetical protein [Candidatus Margulisiibacteriota bacterium]HCY36944.1 hypothetical protein [Candidatus Margulisiibacteriota bacterium]